MEYEYIGSFLVLVVASVIVFIAWWVARYQDRPMFGRDGQVLGKVPTIDEVLEKKFQLYHPLVLSTDGHVVHGEATYGDKRVQFTLIQGGGPPEVLVDDPSLGYRRLWPK